MDAEHLRIKDEIIDVIKKNIKAEHYKIFFFGSRANGSATARSDIDIGIEAQDRIHSRIIGNMKDDLEKIRTLNKFDLVDFNAVDDNFKRVALEAVEMIYEQ